MGCSAVTSKIKSSFGVRFANFAKVRIVKVDGRIGSSCLHTSHKAPHVYGPGTLAICIHVRNCLRSGSLIQVFRKLFCFIDKLVTIHTVGLRVCAPNDLCFSCFIQHFVLTTHLLTSALNTCSFAHPLLQNVNDVFHVAKNEHEMLHMCRQPLEPFQILNLCSLHSHCTKCSAKVVQE